MASAFGTETVLTVRHCTDDYFKFTTTRDPGFRFESGQFVMVGLEIPRDDGSVRPLLRAYSIASASWEEQLEFFSIKIEGGALTSRLRHIQPGDKVLVGRKPTGTLLIRDLNPGRNLFLMGTGTGFAPWLSIVKDPETYNRFENIILCHGVRQIRDLCYHGEILDALPQHEYLGELVRKQLHYYPAVSREDFVHNGHRHRGRLTDLQASGQIASDLGLPRLDQAHDRVMLCGSPGMLADFRVMLDGRGFVASPRIGVPGDYVFERAFVEK